MEKHESNQTKKTFIQLIQENKELITFIGPYLIVLGVLRFYAYYAQFNINILNYLDFSEFITSFFGLSYIIIASFLLFMTGHFLIITLKKSFKIKSSKVKELKSIIFLSFVFSAIPSLLGLLFIEKFECLQFLLTLVVPAVFVIAMGFFLWLLKLYSNDKQKHSNILIAAAILISLMIFDYNSSKIEAKKVILNSKHPVNAAIILDADTLHSSDSLVFAGKTKSFVFLYNPMDATTVILDMQSVKQIRLTPTNDGSPFDKFLGNSIFKNSFW